MRRHPLSDAAREYRSAMWLLAAIAVVAYAAGYAGVRGAVPRLVGLVGLGVGVAVGSALAGRMIDEFGTTAGYAVAAGAALLASMVTPWLFVKQSASTERPSSTR